MEFALPGRTMKSFFRRPGRLLGYDDPGEGSVRTRQIGFAALLGLAVLAVVFFVDLSPQVDESLFFSSSDPQFQEDLRIDELFRTQPQLFVSVRSGADPRSGDYLSNLREISREIQGIDGVVSVRDVLHGPEDVEAAFENPLWSRLLVSEDGQATSIVIVARDEATDSVVTALEEIVESREGSGLEIAVSGAPYVVEQMRRQVVRDLKVFGTAALVVFTLTVAVLYRSGWIVAGMVVSGGLATVLTILVRSLLGMQVDILTPNITTIVFVLTLLHMVFLTNNRNAAARVGDGAEDAVDGAEGSSSPSADPVGTAIRWTLPPSFWAMVTTGLGFLSLLLAPAKPARNLGASGAVGAILALVCAYVVFPAFLASAEPREGLSRRLTERLAPWFRRKNTGLAVAVGVVSLAMIGGLFTLNTDPVLFSYFDGPVRSGLERIDRAGGSSPLELVVRNPDGSELGNDESFERMWALQRDLETDSAVGSVISLPVLMAEAEEQTFFSFLLSWDFMLDRMEDPERDRIAQGFLTRDRDMARFILRMKESALGEGLSRTDAIEEVEASVEEHGFQASLTGGLYALQAKMAELVSSSLLTGLLGLLGLFSIVAFVVSRSFGIAGAMVLGFAMIPVVMLGTWGYLGIPLDVVALPAANLALAIGADDMVHLVFHVRRSDAGFSWDGWVEGRKRLWPAIVGSSLVVFLGFGLLLSSGFPPNRRMGQAVLLGTFVALAVVLVVFPRMALAFAGSEEA